MAHIDQISFIKEFKDFYINNHFNKDIDILEIGSLDVNGNMRNLFNFCKSYSFSTGLGRVIRFLSLKKCLNNRRHKMCLRARCRRNFGDSPVCAKTADIWSEIKYTYTF